jgi:hypothetical protein
MKTLPISREKRMVLRGRAHWRHRFSAARAGAIEARATSALRVIVARFQAAPARAIARAREQRFDPRVMRCAIARMPLRH